MGIVAAQGTRSVPSAQGIGWTREEILAFKRLGKAHRIFALIVDGEPGASENPATADQECFPPALIHELGDDNELSDVRSEPIAADARPGKDPKQAAKLKLLAGMRGRRAAPHRRDRGRNGKADNRVHGRPI